MPRTKKNPVTDMPVEVEFVGSETPLEQPQQQSNVVSINSANSNPSTGTRDTSQIDQWIVDLGITFT